MRHHGDFGLALDLIIRGLRLLDCGSGLLVEDQRGGDLLRMSALFQVRIRCHCLRALRLGRLQGAACPLKLAPGGDDTVLVRRHSLLFGRDLLHPGTGTQQVELCLGGSLVGYGGRLRVLGRRYGGRGLHALRLY